MCFPAPRGEIKVLKFKSYFKIKFCYFFIFYYLLQYLNFKFYLIVYKN